MQYHDIFESLGARALRSDATYTQQINEETFEIHSELKDLLSQFDGGIVFDNGAKFKPSVKLPTCDKHGYVDVVIIYGISEDSNNIYLANKMYRDQIGKEFYVFGESSGGDQFCLDRQTGEIYYWYHEAKTHDLSMFKIAISLSGFIGQLVPDEDDSSNKSTGIISSHFDF